jgi:hypothetical protein
MRARPAQLDNHAALEQARQARSPATAPGPGFPLSTPIGGAPSAGASATGVTSISVREGANAALAPGDAVRANASLSLPSDHTTASVGGSLLLQLQHLGASDPAKFQAAAASIADRLQDSADHASESNAKAVTALIISFRAASYTGAPPSLASLGAAAPPAGTNPYVARYAQSNTSAGSSFAGSALESAVRDVLGDPSRVAE